MVCAEELSGYAHPEEMWAKLNIITQGSPVDGISTRGFSYAICNASANEGYDRLTKEKAPPVVDAKKPFAFDPAVYRSWG